MPSAALITAPVLCEPTLPDVPAALHHQENVEKFMLEKKTTVEITIGAFTEMLQKYKLMEASLSRQKLSLKLKIPEIDNTLDLVRLLKHKRDSEEEMLANYPLSEVNDKLEE